MTRETVPYGTWNSPVTAEIVAGKTLRFGTLKSRRGTVYWTESRPWEDGRSVIVGCSPPVESHDSDYCHDMLPAPYSARSKVHEYGGGEFSLMQKGEIYFVNAADQDIYVIDHGRIVRRITSAPEWRFADIVEDPKRDRLIAVGERHNTESGAHPENLLVTIALDGSETSEISPLIEGADFYSNPQLDTDGDRLAWLQWSLPHMPWETAALKVCLLDQKGAPQETVHVAGGTDSSVFQPEWTEDGKLLFIWNESGWGNPYVWDGKNTARLLELDAEFGRPQWVFGMRSYTQCRDGSIMFSFLENGAFQTKRLVDGMLEPIDLGFIGLDSPSASDVWLFGVAMSDATQSSIADIDLWNSWSNREIRVLFRPVADVDIAEAGISVGKPVTFASAADRVTHAIYYAPTHEHFKGPAAEKPPAIILIHGGPTGYADRGLKLKTQYWTSRGFAVLDVDFTGSFGYGADYRQALNGLWGIADAEDAAAGARWLAEMGYADPARIAIAGGSSGGYTVLSALTRHDEFAAGASYYGISDVYRLAQSTHKFEAGYVETLTNISPDAPAEAYRQISPIFHADKINVPVILFQGLEDFVVPPDQSRGIADALKARGVSVIYREYEGEGHGFRKADTLMDALAHEHAFYAAVFGLQPADDLPDIHL